jgi:hypothetical protein
VLDRYSGFHGILTRSSDLRLLAASARGFQCQQIEGSHRQVDTTGLQHFDTWLTCIWPARTKSTASPLRALGRKHSVKVLYIVSYSG